MTIPPLNVIEIIQRKKLQYGRFVDTKQWQRFHEIALPEARLSFFNPGGSPLQVGSYVYAYDSLEQYTSRLKQDTARGQVFHMFSRGEFEQVDAKTVKAIFSMEDVFILDGTFGLVQSRGGGFYYETWREVDGDWFMAELRLERLYVTDSVLFAIIVALINVGVVVQSWFR